MAAVTVQSDAVKSGVKPEHQVPVGVVLCRIGKYTNSGAKDANSVVEMVPIPKGAQIVGMAFESSALGAGRTVDIGIGTTVDLFFDGLDVSTAGVFGPADMDGNGVIGYEFAANDTIDVKVLGDDLPDKAVLRLAVFYKMQGAIADEDF